MKSENKDETVKLPHDPLTYALLSENEKQQVHDVILETLEPFFDGLQATETDNDEGDS